MFVFRVKIEPDLLSVLNKLKDSNDLQQWKTRLFNIYGTHVATAIDIGGKMEMTTKFRSISGDATDESSLSTSFSIGIKGKGNVSAEAATNSATESAVNSGLVIDENSFRCFGGSDAECGSTINVDKWKASVRQHPAVISQKLAPLSQIVPEVYRVKVTEMIAAYSNWIKEQCPGGAENTCDGHGQCSSSGICMCDKGYGGSDCKTRIIPYDAKVTMAGNGKSATAYPCQETNGMKYTGCWNLDNGPLKGKLGGLGKTCYQSGAAPVEGTCVDFWNLNGKWSVGGSGSATCTSEVPGPNGGRRLLGTPNAPNGGRRLLGRGGVYYMGRECLLNGKSTTYDGQPKYEANGKSVCMSNMFIVPGYECAKP